VVLREAYLETTEDLRCYADKVRYFNEIKKAIRDELARLRDYQAAARGLTVEPYRRGAAADSGTCRCGPSFCRADVSRAGSSDHRGCEAGAKFGGGSRAGRPGGSDVDHAPQDRGAHDHEPANIGSRPLGI